MGALSKSFQLRECQRIMLDESDGKLMIVRIKEF